MRDAVTAYVRDCLAPATALFGRNATYTKLERALSSAIALHERYLGNKDWGASSTGEPAADAPDYRMASEIRGKLRESKARIDATTLRVGTMRMEGEMHPIAYLDAGIRKQLEGVRELCDRFSGGDV